VQLAEYKSLLVDSIKYARSKNLTGEELVNTVCDKLAVTFGSKILELIPGVVSTEVDANLSFDTAKSIEKHGS